MYFYCIYCNDCMSPSEACIIMGEHIDSDCSYEVWYPWESCPICHRGKKQNWYVRFYSGWILPSNDMESHHRLLRRAIRYQRNC